jgi:hypothetical protein
LQQLRVEVHDMLAELADEQTRLRHSIMRMQTILCFAKDPRAEADMRELTGDAEARLIAQQAKP